MGFLQAVFTDPYVAIALSSTAVYLFIILAIRLFGKRELAQLSVVDLVFILLISNAVQNAMVGSNSSLAGGLVAAGTLFVVNLLFKSLLSKFPKLGRMVQGEAVPLVHKGEILREGMRESGITEEELLEAVREHGVASIREVDLAVLEVDGNISVLSADYRTRTVRRRRGRGRKKDGSN